MSFWTSLSTGDDLAKAIGKTVEDAATTDEERLEQAEELARSRINYDREMKQLALKDRELNTQDRNSARAMQTQVQISEHASPLARNIAPMMAIVTTLLTFVLFFWLLKDDGTTLTGGKKDIVLYILGALSAIMTQIFSFYFGSSQGSADKNKMLERMRERGSGQS